jgi:hypothetical protein
MSRFAGEGALTPPLDAILFEDFTELRIAPIEKDAEIESFSANLETDFFENLSTIRMHKARTIWNRYDSSASLNYQTIIAVRCMFL